MRIVEIADPGPEWDAGSLGRCGRCIFGHDHRGGHREHGKKRCEGSLELQRDRGIICHHNTVDTGRIAGYVPLRAAKRFKDPAPWRTALRAEHSKEARLDVTGAYRAPVRESHPRIEMKCVAPAIRGDIPGFRRVGNHVALRGEPY